MGPKRIQWSEPPIWVCCGFSEGDGSVAWYKDDAYLTRTSSSHEWWSTTYDAGAVAPVSGIYRCPGCGKEIAHNQDEKLPPQNHHQHSDDRGKVRWRLLVRSNTKGE
jgi:hypothetical protein